MQGGNLLGGRFLVTSLYGALWKKSLSPLGESHNIEIWRHCQAPPGLPLPKVWSLVNTFFRRYGRWEPIFSCFQSTLLHKKTIKKFSWPSWETHNLEIWWQGRSRQGLPLPIIWHLVNTWFRRYWWWEPFVRRFLVTSLYGAFGEKPLSSLGESHNIEILWHVWAPPRLYLPKVWPLVNTWLRSYARWEPFFRRFLVTSLYGALGKKSLSPLGESHNIEIWRHGPAPPGLPLPKVWPLVNTWFRRYRRWEPFFGPIYYIKLYLPPDPYLKTPPDL